MTAAVLALGVAAAPPAQADQYGGTTGDGFNLQAVTVVVTGGKGDPVSGGSISVSVPPVCWWVPFNPENYGYFDIDPSDPDAMAQYLEGNRDNTTITFLPALLSHPSPGYLAAHAGPDWTWYQLESASGVNCAEEGFTPSGGNGPPGWVIGGSQAIPVSYQAFPTGTPPPPPAVDVDDVVQEVWDAASAEVEAPDLDRNPKAVDLGGAALVNMPTWFWVQNVDGALAQDGAIHLEISIPGTPVQATLDAETTGVQVTSPAGATTCSVEESKTEWASGAAEGDACTFPFDRANRAGWPVTAQTTWTGTWQGTDRNGPTGGNLEALTTSATTNVPVVESQTLVTDVD